MVYISRTPTPDSLPVDEDVFRSILDRAELLADPDVRAYLLALAGER